MFSIQGNATLKYSIANPCQYYQNTMCRFLLVYFIYQIMN